MDDGNASQQVCCSCPATVCSSSGARIAACTAAAAAAALTSYLTATREKMTGTAWPGHMAANSRAARLHLTRQWCPCHTASDVHVELNECWKSGIPGTHRSHQTQPAPCKPTPAAPLRTPVASQNLEGLIIKALPDSATAWRRCGRELLLSQRSARRFACLHQHRTQLVSLQWLRQWFDAHWLHTHWLQARSGGQAQLSVADSKILTRRRNWPAVVTIARCGQPHLANNNSKVMTLKAFLQAFRHCQQDSSYSRSSWHGIPWQGV